MGSVEIHMTSLSFAISGGVATLTIEPPAAQNEIDITVIRDLHSALNRIQEGDSGARAVVLAGSNDMFCGGVDLQSVDLSADEAGQENYSKLRCYMDALILTFHLPRRIGGGRSLAMLLLAKSIDASTANAIT